MPLDKPSIETMTVRSCVTRSYAWDKMSNVLMLAVAIASVGGLGQVLCVYLERSFDLEPLREACVWFWGFAALIACASVLWLPFIIFDGIASRFTFDADGITIHRSRFRILEAFLLSTHRKCELLPSMLADSTLEYALRPRHWRVGKEELVSVYFRHYGEGALFRIFTATGSIDLFPYGLDEDLERVAKELKRWTKDWSQHLAWDVVWNRDTLERQSLTAIIEEAPAGFTLESLPRGPVRIRYRGPNAGVAFVWSMVIAVAWTFVTATVLRIEQPDWPMYVQMGLIAVGGLPLLLAMQYSAERWNLLIEEHTVKVTHKRAWRRSRRIIAVGTVRQIVSGYKGDNALVWRVELGDSSKPIWTGNDETTHWISSVISCAVQRPLYPSLVMEEKGWRVCLRDSAAEP